MDTSQKFNNFCYNNPEYLTEMASINLVELIDRDII